MLYAKLNKPLALVIKQQVNAHNQQKEIVIGLVMHVLNTQLVLPLHLKYLTNLTTQLIVKEFIILVQLIQENQGA